MEGGDCEAAQGDFGAEGTEVGYKGGGSEGFWCMVRKVERSRERWREEEEGGPLGFLGSRR